MREDAGRCARCPVAPERECAGVDIQRLCELTNPLHPDFNATYQTMLDHGPKNIDVQDDLPAPKEGMTKASLPTVSEAIARLTAMKSCSHRQERTDCGCAGVALCRLGRGSNGIVNHVDCIKCIINN